MSTMRDLLLRVQLDPEFADLVRAEPETAAVEYSLTPDEMESLRRLDTSLYRYLTAAEPFEGEDTAISGTPPPPLPDLTMVSPETTLPRPMQNLHPPAPDQHPPPAPDQHPPPPRDLSMVSPATTLPRPMSHLQHAPDERDRGGERWTGEEANPALAAEIRASQDEERLAKLLLLIEDVQ